MWVCCRIVGCILFALTMFNRVEPLDNLEDPTQLSHHLDALPSADRSKCMTSLIIRATTDPRKKELLMLLPEPVVHEIMEGTRVVRLSFIGLIPGYARVDRISAVLIQLLQGVENCEVCTADPERRTRPLRRLLIALGRSTQTVPRSFLINGIHLTDIHPVIGGGFADIFRGTYDGEAVALKRLRHYTNRSTSRLQENVSGVHWAFSSRTKTDER